MDERRKPVLGRMVPGVSPAMQRRLRRVFVFLQRLSPELAGKLALRLFLTPPRRKVDADDVPIIAQALKSTLDCGGFQIALWHWGNDAPRVVLLHGWGSHAARFGSFVAPLRAAGFSVIAIDAPAHGASPGRMSDLPRFRDSLAAVLREYAPVHAVVGHSLGGGAALTVLAEAAEHHPLKLCLFGVPCDMAYILDSFAMMLGLNARALAVLHRRFAEHFGMAAQEISVTAAGPRIRLPALVVHDEEDVVAPFAHGEQLSRALPAATLLRTQGLGHSGALRDAATIERVVRFLSEQATR